MTLPSASVEYFRIATSSGAAAVRAADRVSAAPKATSKAQPTDETARARQQWFNEAVPRLLHNANRPRAQAETLALPRTDSPEVWHCLLQPSGQELNRHGTRDVAGPDCPYLLVLHAIHV